MGALKVRVGGAWVTIPGYGNTIGVPLGGVLGDLLIKNSATDGDARWGVDPPKMTLTSTTDATLTSTAHALTVGPTTSVNMAMSQSRIQARTQAGATNPLFLNYLGGDVIVGGNDPSYPILSVAESAAAGHKRASFKLGSWGWYQDTQLNNTKNLGLLSPASNWPLTFSANGLTIDLGSATSSTVLIGTGTSSIVQLGSGIDANVRIGDDAAFRDANVGHMLKLESRSNTTLGLLCFGMTSKYIGNDTNMTLKSDGPVYYDGTAHYFRAVNGTSLYLHSGSNFHVETGSFYCSGDIYSGTNYWIRVRGSMGFYWQDYDVGFKATGSGRQVHLYGSGAVFAIDPSQAIRLYAPSDTNHTLQYTSTTPGGSGEASNGPILRGYSSVWLHQAIANKSLFLAANGNAFLSAGNSWTNFSSRQFKENIEPLDPADLLATVLRWRPVEFDFKDDDEGHAPGRRHAHGFISEEMVEVTPSVVNVTAPTDDKPNWPNAIDYSNLTVHLTGAVQALAARIEQLERNAA